MVKITGGENENLAHPEQVACVKYVRLIYAVRMKDGENARVIHAV